MQRKGKKAGLALALSVFMVIGSAGIIPAAEAEEEMQPVKNEDTVLDAESGADTTAPQEEAVSVVNADTAAPFLDA